MSEPVYVDPQMSPILQAMRERAAADPWVPGRDPRQMRQRMRADLARWNVDPPPLARVEDLALDGPTGPVTVRRYDPAGGSRLQPALLYLHGGGWVAGDLETEDRASRLLAAASGVTVLSVDYPLAPEHPFPVPIEACRAVWKAAHAGGAALGIDSGRLALGGSSAGANLALACALTLRNAGEPLPRFLLLNYGAYGDGSDTASARRFGDGSFGLGRAQMEYFRSLYLQRPEDRHDPRAAPLLADLRGLPATFMTAAALDPLLDDSLELDTRLAAAGVPHRCIVYPGVVHGFTLMNLSLGAARAAIEEAAAALRAALA